MTTYVINRRNKTFAYSAHDNLIRVGGYNMDNLSDNETSELMADNFTHEYVHKLLFEMFDFTICKLFDAVEHHFRNVKLQAKQLDVGANGKRETYQSLIKRSGFDAFLDHYMISEYEIRDALRICNDRDKGGEKCHL